jgi:hypothetical protein
METLLIIVLLVLLWPITLVVLIMGAAAVMLAGLIMGVAMLFSAVPVSAAPDLVWQVLGWIVGVVGGLATLYYCVWLSIVDIVNWTRKSWRARLPSYERRLW